MFCLWAVCKLAELLWLYELVHHVADTSIQKKATTAFERKIDYFHKGLGYNLGKYVAELFCHFTILPRGNT
jgi:hypothetical protein